MSFEEYCQLISELSNVPVTKIERQSSFRDDLDLDSLQMVNLIVEISSRFGLDMPKIQSNEDLKTVENMYKIFTGEC
ncbi:phosphopantetheine-binding protein [Sporosarcina sp. 179-K 8C2 HS]|uniref:acyl carrier protein n=1 Tax=Sporosarcina sp. 179-K 8C2 HS TaxID=3142387 RepID=UPI00399F220B